MYGCPEVHRTCILLKLPHSKYEDFRANFVTLTDKYQCCDHFLLLEASGSKAEIFLREQRLSLFGKTTYFALRFFECQLQRAENPLFLPSFLK